MIKKCLFPAAGYGTRFLPATKSMPKEMLPIVDKPLIQYGVEEALEAGMNNIGIVTGRGKRALADHFDVSYELEHQISGSSKEGLLKDIRKILDECTFSYTRQAEMKGLGHAILTGETLIGREPFGVILADDLCVGEEHGVLSQMAAIYEKYQCSVILVEEVPPQETQKYGIVEVEGDDGETATITSIVEKPRPEDAPSNLGVVGRYILTPRIFDLIRKTGRGAGGEIQLTDAIAELLKYEKVRAYRIKGKRYDCGSKLGYLEATVEYGLEHPELGESFAAYLRELAASL